MRGFYSVIPGGPQDREEIHLRTQCYGFPSPPFRSGRE